MFRSDKQRKAMFANMFSTIPKGNCHNKFALYVNDTDDPRANFVRSTIYPDVNVPIRTDDDHMRMLVEAGNFNKDDERNFAGLELVRSMDLEGPEACYNCSKERGGSTIPAIFIDEDIDKLGGDSEHVLKHELAHHIDDELTDDKYISAPDYFEHFTNYATDTDKYKKRKKEIEEELTSDISEAKKEILLEDLEFIDLLEERYAFADKLNRLKTPTFNELTRNAIFKRVMVPTDEAYKMRENWAGPDGMVQKRSDITMKKIEDEIKSNKFYPIEVRRGMFEDGFLSDGKHRILAAKKLGLKTVPVDVGEDV